jgi:hypothetical protein
VIDSYEAVLGGGSRSRGTIAARRCMLHELQRP